jgi:hypothetical protein
MPIGIEWRPAVDHPVVSRAVWRVSLPRVPLSQRGGGLTPGPSPTQGAAPALLNLGSYSGHWFSRVKENCFRVLGYLNSDTHMRPQTRRHTYAAAVAYNRLRDGGRDNPFDRARNRGALTSSPDLVKRSLSRLPAAAAHRRIILEIENSGSEPSQKNLICRSSYTFPRSRIRL